MVRRPLASSLKLFANFIPGGITNFFNQLIKSFGYTSQQSLLYATPGGAVEIVALIACGFAGDYYKNRILVATSGLIVAIIGMALIVGLPLGNDSGRLAGYYLTQASPTPFVAFLSLISSNVAGYTKKTTVAALYLIGYWFVPPNTTPTIHITLPLIHPQRRQHHRPSNLPP